MPRPVKCRRIERLPDFRSFSPDDINASETVLMSLDEYETLRIMDVEGATQEECAVKMNIARTTVTAIYDSARKKVADAIVHGKRLLIAGGCWTVEPVQTSQETSKIRHCLYTHTNSRCVECDYGLARDIRKPRYRLLHSSQQVSHHRDCRIRILR